MKLQDLEFELQRVPLKKGEILSVVINSDDAGDDIRRHMQLQFKEAIEKMNAGFHVPVFVFSCGENEDVCLQSVEVQDGDLLTVSVESDEEVPQAKLDQLEKQFQDTLAAMGTEVAVLAVQVPEGADVNVEVTPNPCAKMTLFSDIHFDTKPSLSDRIVKLWQEKYRVASSFRTVEEQREHLKDRFVGRPLHEVEREMVSSFTPALYCYDIKAFRPDGSLIVSPQVKAEYDKLFPTRDEYDEYVRGDTLHYEDVVRASGGTVPAEHHSRPVTYAANLVDTVDSREAERRRAWGAWGGAFDSGKDLTVLHGKISPKKSVLATNQQSLSSSKEAIEQLEEALKKSGYDAKPTPIMNAAEVAAYRKKEGLCLECGDRGTFVGTACMCTNGHGKIFG